MSNTIDVAVGELIKRQHGTISYTDTGKEVVVLSNPAHYSLNIKMIDNKARKNKKASVKLDRTYTYPKEIEYAVLWDVLVKMRGAIIQYTSAKEQISWNEIFGEKYPQLMIKIPEPSQLQSNIIGEDNLINNIKSDIEEQDL